MGGGKGGGIAGSGGSFGGFGGNSGAVNSIVNFTYGDLATTLLQGGSGGGGGDSGVCVSGPCPVGGAGGGGGGGIEIGALGNIEISGFVLAHGGPGGDGIDGSASAGGGGASGGGISMHGATVTFLDSGGLRAAGGFGGNSIDSYGGGGGGGGRVLILTSAGGTVSGFIDVLGGGGGSAVSSPHSGTGQPGQLGVITFGQLPPEPFPFQGFFTPVQNPQMVNTVKAGQAIPVKFSLGGDRGLAIFAAGSPASRSVSCVGFSGSDPIEETVSAGASSLQYDPETEIYIYVWKTAKNWANTCRMLSLTLTDGSVHEAFFQFLK